MDLPETHQPIAIMGYQVTLKTDMFPELYEVTRNNQFVGTISVRHQELRVQDAEERLVYRTRPYGSGTFADHERQFYLAQAVRMLKSHLDCPRPRHVDWHKPFALRGFTQGEVAILDVHHQEGAGVVTLFLGFQGPDGTQRVDVMAYDEGMGTPLNPIFRDMDIYYIDNIVFDDD